MYQWIGLLLFPELRQIPPGHPRRDAWRRAFKAVPRWPSTVAAVAMAIAFISYFGLFRGAARYSWATWPFAIAVSAFLTWWYRQRVLRVLRSDLNARGSRLCVPCGYDLSHSPGSTCPECGSLFVPPPPQPTLAPPDSVAPSALVRQHRERRPLPPRLLD